MRSYEMMTILHPDLDTEAHESALKKIEKLITDNDGKVETIDRLGKKRLAYEINHLNDGNYSVIYFDSAPETVKEVDRVLKISDDVVRFMIIKKQG